MVVCNGLKGTPRPSSDLAHGITQVCVLHLIRHTFHLVSRRDSDAMAKEPRTGLHAINEVDAGERLAEFHDTWGDTFPAIKGLWVNAWAEFVPFLDFSPEIRR